MRLFTTGSKGWKQYWKNDLKASVSVAFIAIPLGLGIGLASGVPPLAAVIPCVVGGLVVAWFSGGNVAVHSTPKMLIGVTALAVLSMGEGDPFAGYRLFLSAVVVAGLAQFTLGLLRLGIIGDLIPATVIKSLLSAVGIIIIVKQIPIIIGAHFHGKSVMDVLSHLDIIMPDWNPVIFLIGLISVLVMFLHPKVGSNWIRAIPAAVWVIMLAEAYSYMLDFEQGGTILWSDTVLAYGKQDLVSIPKKLSAALVSPDFSMWQTALFWNTVVAIVIVSSIEGILSAKAIDRLDPLKRKTNVNKELRAVGLGTSMSGMIGGLPIIPAIVASSVGVNHNGKTQLMDVFQALLILGMIVIFGSQIGHIPLAALAGILIHTGYKLLNPTEIRNIYRIGPDELLIYLSTLFTTLATDLIIGITVGVTLTVVLHMIRLRSVVKLFTILFRPNVVSYLEDDRENTYHISVKGYSNFLNYPQLKKALDVIPHDAAIIVDFSLAEFIDHTVMEHLAEYEENHIRKGGQFEVIGLDTHLASADHHLSTRFKGVKVGVSGNQTLTSRQQKLRELAERTAWKFDPSVTLYPSDLEKFHLFLHQRVDRAYNKLAGELNGFHTVIQDVDFHEGEFHTKVEGQTTLAIIHLHAFIPLFTIEKEHLLDRIAALAGYDDIDFEKFKTFSKTFRLKGADEMAIRRFFTPELIAFLESNLSYRMESSGDQLLLVRKARIMSVPEIERLQQFCTELTGKLPSQLNSN